MEFPRTILHWTLVAAATGAIAFFCVGLTSYFERRDDKPRWVRVIHDAGMWLSLAYLGGVIFLQPRSDAFVIAGIVMYAAAVAVFLAAIEAADRTRLQRMYVDQPLPDRLITDGPYRWVRHPFYFGYISGALAPVVAMDHLLMPLLSIVVVAITVSAAFREERIWLASPRAEAYRQYRRRTGMFLPLIGRG